MRLFNLLFLLYLLAPAGKTYAQQQDFIKQPNLKIVNAVLSNKDKEFPVLYITLRNSSSVEFILNTVKLKLISYKSNGSKTVPETQVLAPIASWDLELPRERTLNTYQTASPLQIASGKPATIKLRFHCLTIGDRPALPQEVGTFVLQVYLVNSQNKGVSSKQYSIVAN